MHIVASVMITLTAAINISGAHYETLKQEAEYNYKSKAEIISHFDGLIEACGVENYFIVGDGAELVGHSKYSPVGPIPFQLPMMPQESPLLTEYYTNGLAKAQFALRTEHARFGNPIHNLIMKQGFTQQPPACAKPFLPFPEDTYQMYFRMKK